MAPTIALAGRRIDAPDAETPRFPLANVSLVRERLRVLLVERQVATLVSSAACGADLVALEVAGELGLRRRVVLPFDAAKFRDSSVTDRPGDWGSLYDHTIEAVRRAGDLVILEDAGEGSAAYGAANRRILEETRRLTGTQTGPVPAETAFAVIVWEGRSRGGDDATEQFAAGARRCGLNVEEVLTM